MKAIKKPIEVEVIKWDGINLQDIVDFVGDSLEYSICDSAWQVGKGIPHVFMKVKTLEGNLDVSEGDYIIKGVQGEFYPCKLDIFEKTYDIVPDLQERMNDIAMGYY